MLFVKDKKTEREERKKRDLKILYHEKIHQENREKAQKADGGYGKTPSLEEEYLAERVMSWVDKIEAMRSKVTEGRSHALEMWKSTRGRRPRPKK